MDKIFLPLTLPSPHEWGEGKTAPHPALSPRAGERVNKATLPVGGAYTPTFYKNLGKALGFSSPAFRESGR